MNTYSKTSFLLMILVIFSCTEDPAFKQTINETVINDYVKTISNFPSPPEASKLETGSAELAMETDNGGMEFLCNRRQFEETFVLDNLTLSAFNNKNATNTAALYPGSLIRLKELQEINDLNGIGSYERQPIQVNSTLGDIREVIDPSQRGNVDKAIKEIENSGNSFAAQINFQVTEAYSLRQSLYTLGIDANYIGNSVSADLELEQSVEKKSVFVKFFQVYHTVSITNPQSPAEFFGPSVTLEDVESFTREGAPVGYIAEVAYGRMLVGNFTYTGSEIRTSAELAVEVRKGLANGSANYSQESKTTLKNSTFIVAILGGDSQEASKVSGTGAEALESAFEFLQNGGQDRALGVPVQYKVRYLSNNELFALGGTAGYSEPNCDALNNQVTIQKITLRKFPAKKNSKGDDWDPGAIGGAVNPDIYLQIRRKTGSSFKVEAEYENLKKNNLESSELPANYSPINFVVNENFLNSDFNILLIDNDPAPNPDDTMGSVTFNFREFLRSVQQPDPDNPYPSEIEVSTSSISMTLTLKWSVVN